MESVFSTFGIYLIPVIIGWIICGALTSYVASEKGYAGTSWMLIGLFCGPMGLIAAAGLPTYGTWEKLHREEQARIEASVLKDDSEVRNLIDKLNL